MKVKISNEQKDEILVKSLLESIDITFESIQDLMGKGHLESYQMQDLVYDIEYLKAAKLVYKHFTLDTSELDKYEL